MNKKITFNPKYHKYQPIIGIDKQNRLSTLFSLHSEGLEFQNNKWIMRYLEIDFLGTSKESPIFLQIPS